MRESKVRLILGTFYKGRSQGTKVMEAEGVGLDKNQYHYCCRGVMGWWNQLEIPGSA